MANRGGGINITGGNVFTGRDMVGGSVGAKTVKIIKTDVGEIVLVAPSDYSDRNIQDAVNQNAAGLGGINNMDDLIVLKQRLIRREDFSEYVERQIVVRL